MKFSIKHCRWHVFRNKKESIDITLVERDHEILLEFPWPIECLTFTRETAAEFARTLLASAEKKTVLLEDAANARSASKKISTLLLK